MGEIADMMIDGLLDCETGEVIDGHATGYPRTKHKQLEASVKCQKCGKKLRSEQGVKDHERDVHGATR